MESARNNAPLLIASVILIGLVGLLVPQDARAFPSRDLSQLSFGIRLSPDLVSWFNQAARPTDSVAVPFRDVNMLDGIKVGQKMVLFASMADAESNVPSMAGKITGIIYDPEHWPYTPADEQANLGAATKRLRTLANTYGLKAAVAPDRRFLAEQGAQIAPDVDIMYLQLQLLQGDPNMLLDFARVNGQAVRRANPNIELRAQLNTERGVDQLITLSNSLNQEIGIDGVAVLYSPATEQTVKDFVANLRAGAAAPPSATTPPLSSAPKTPTRASVASATPAPPGTKATSTLVPSTATPTSALSPSIGPTVASPTPRSALPQPSLPPLQCASPSGLLLLGVGMIAYVGSRRSGRITK